MQLNTEEDRFHIQRISARLGDEGVKRAFGVLLKRLSAQTRFEVRGSPHGAFSDINVKYLGRRCYAFRGTKSWIAWYFRKPSFQEGLADPEKVVSSFSEFDPFENPSKGEIWVKIKTPEDARLVLEFVEIA